MKPMAISILFFLIPIASAIDFSFNSPDSTFMGENISISISASVSENYDVKISIEDETGTTISEIYNKGWKNPYYYLNSVFPEQTNFIIRAISHSDNALICVKLRKTGSSSSPTPNCKSIFLEADNSKSTQTQSSKVPEESNKADSQSETIPIQNSDFIPSRVQTLTPVGAPENIQDKILLNPGDNNVRTFVTNDEKLRIYSIYAFTALVIVILSFLVMKKL